MVGMEEDRRRATLYPFMYVIWDRQFVDVACRKHNWNAIAEIEKQISFHVLETVHLAQTAGPFLLSLKSLQPAETLL